MYEKWQQMYAEKLKTPQEAVKMVEDGDAFSFPTMSGTPRVLTHAFAQYFATGAVKDIDMVVGLNLNAPELIKPEVTSKVHYCAGYISPFERPAAIKNEIDYFPLRFNDIPRLMEENRGTNVIMMTVAPMDEHGYFSAGMNCSHTYSLFRRLKEHGKPFKVFLEVNKKAPRCFGFNQFHISDVTALIEADWDPITLPAEESDECDVALAHYIAQEIPDGATVQLGIGKLPNAIGKELAHKKDLGCHTEMIVDAYLDLYKCGALNNSKKTYMSDRFVGTIIAGSKELFDWINNNPSVIINGIEECADPAIIARHDNFMAINSIMECDLSGQAISESSGIRPYSGMGGQADFHLGARLSNGGKSFLCLPSTYTDKNGKMHSKIKPVCNGWIGITRYDVMYIATEYGCVNLSGRTMHERVALMISIAHPDFREELLEEAVKLGIIGSANDINLKAMRQHI